MLIVFVIVLMLTCIILGFIILVQNPKGGGLAANIGGGMGNQFMGVKQTNDVLEKGTWVFAGIIGLLCLFSVALIPNSTGGKQNLLDQINAKPTTTNTVPLTTPQPVSPQPVAPANP